MRESKSDRLLDAPRDSHHYRGRFAPSPTGPLHFGSLVAALASYCDARAAGGEWLVRIEDVDEPRSRPGAESAILHSLTRYGFAWDGPIVRQSERSAAYESALAQLRAIKAVYPCACTRRELEAAPFGAAGERVYPGTCRNRMASGEAPRAQRVRVEATAVAFVDRLQGPQRQDLARDIGDFVVRRADGLYAYQLAVVVDDALQGVTTIVRGADLLASTPRQIFLQRLLGVPTPDYLHVPVAINRARGKAVEADARATAAGRSGAAIARRLAFPRSARSRRPAGLGSRVPRVGRSRVVARHAAAGRDVARAPRLLAMNRRGSRRRWGRTRRV